MKRTPDVEKILQLRDHYLAEARKCEDALAVLQQVQKLTRTAESKVARVSQRSGRMLTPGGERSRRTREQRASGTRPVDIIRQTLTQVKGPVTAEDIQQRAALDIPRQSQVVGIILSQMVKRRELKRTGDHYTVRKLRLPDVDVNSNGAQP